VEEEHFGYLGCFLLTLSGLDQRHHYLDQHSYKWHLFLRDDIDASLG
jgi:hypothetical protein